MNQKLLVYIKFIRKTNNFDFNINPTMEMVNKDGECNVYQFLSAKPAFDFQVTVTDITPGEALIIEKITINDIDVTTEKDKFGSYITESGNKKATYGYMDEPGTYKFKIKQNVIFTKYLSYLIDKSNG